MDGQMTLQDVLQTALESYRAGRLGEAESGCREVLGRMPNSADALHLLGLVALRAGKLEAARDLFARAVSLSPENADFVGNLGLALALTGSLDDGITALGRSLQLRPENPGVLYNMADAMCAKQQWGEAIALYEKAAVLRPHDAESYRNFGRALLRTRQFEKAIRQCRASLAMQPNHPDAYHTLGLALEQIFELDGAVEAFENAVRLKPDYVEAANQLANLYSQTGQLRLAMEFRDRAVAIDPARADAASNRIYAMYFDPRFSSEDLLRESKRWDQQYGQPLRDKIRPHENDRSLDRPLRIGYVFPNIHLHPAFIPPLLLNHDTRRFQMYCYSDLELPRVVTDRMETVTQAWRVTRGRSDAELADQIRADGVDILVDLVLHMSGSRLLAFAHKPAPIQVSHLAYPGTTGLATMDYRLTDSYIDPAGSHEAWYTEEPVRLLPTFACYDPRGMDIADEPPETALPPAAAHRHVTFGCLNNFLKVNEGVLQLWSRVLAAVPHSRLRLLAPAGESRNRVAKTMKDLGIDPARIAFVGRKTRAGYFAEFRRIDICLDTFPYAGHTTSLDAIWKGVPVVSRVGTTAAGRVGLSLAGNLQLDNMAAQSDEEFIRYAVELAGDVPLLTQLRRTLRQRLLASPIMNGPAYARAVEEAYSMMWRKWAAGA